jgi:hypothetical protein
MTNSKEQQAQKQPRPRVSGNEEDAKSWSSTPPFSIDLLLAICLLISMISVLIHEFIPSAGLWPVNLALCSSFALISAWAENGIACGALRSASLFLVSAMVSGASLSLAQGAYLHSIIVFSLLSSILVSLLIFIGIFFSVKKTWRGGNGFLGVALIPAGAIQMMFCFVMFLMLMSTWISCASFSLTPGAILFSAILLVFSIHTLLALRVEEVGQSTTAFMVSYLLIRQAAFLYAGDKIGMWVRSNILPVSCLDYVVAVLLVLGMPRRSLLSRIKTSPIVLCTFMAMFLVGLVVFLPLGVQLFVDVLPHGLASAFASLLLLLGTLLSIYCISLSLSDQLPVEHKNMKAVLSIVEAVLLGCASAGYYCSVWSASTGLEVHPSTPLASSSSAMLSS